MMKLCNRCVLHKNEELFAWRNKEKGIRQTYCRDCRKGIDKQYKGTVEFKLRKRQNKKKIFERNTRIVGKILLTSKCVDCGNSNPLVLEFDHIKEKKYNISDLVFDGSEQTLLEEISKCEIRCANCHRIKTAKQFGWQDKFNNLGVG